MKMKGLMSKKHHPNGIKIGKLIKKRAKKETYQNEVLES